MMTILLTQNETTKKVVAKLKELDKETTTQETTYAVLVKAPNITGVARIVDKVLKAWKKDDPKSDIDINLRNVISIMEL